MFFSRMNHIALWYTFGILYWVGIMYETECQAMFTSQVI